MEMTEPVRAAVQSAVLCWLATADADGRPSVSPKEIFAVVGDDIVIAHIASPRSVRNIAGNPQVCLSVLDVFEQRGYRIAGRASVVTPDHDAFPTVVAPLRELSGAAFPCKTWNGCRLPASGCTPTSTRHSDEPVSWRPTELSTRPHRDEGGIAGLWVPAIHSRRPRGTRQQRPPKHSKTPV